MVKPFLRWAGGKRWILKHFSEFFPNLLFNNYHEPFLGGASLFLFLRPQKKAYLSDLNVELIETYVAVRDDIDRVISELRKFKNTEEVYYKIRNSTFKSDYKRAARFIFLNQTSFNGIYRVNLKGEYNVPYGYRKVNFFDPHNLRAVSENLKNAVLDSKDFSLCIANVKKDDLVFLDPPYTITHNNNGFFKYNKNLFSETDQRRLSQVIDQIKAKQAFYILTNAAHDRVKTIFNKGDRVMEFQRASLVGGAQAERGKYEELLITNIQ